MASGHVNRTYRPNTWQHRPSLRREDSSCQPGAVHTWHFSDLALAPCDIEPDKCGGREVLVSVIAQGVALVFWGTAKCGGASS